jgi:hypothetical protein
MAAGGTSINKGLLFFHGGSLAWTGGKFTVGMTNVINLSTGTYLYTIFTRVR